LPETSVTSATASAFSDREFRDVLGLFATGVTVVTAVSSDGTRLGATISSFGSLSLDPPLVLFSLSRRAAGFKAWSGVEAFAVNILAEDQSAMSTRFARAMTDKWDGIVPAYGENRCPLLNDALAWIECSSWDKHDGGDHLIFVGRVDRLTVRNREALRPLLFFRGQYRRLDSEQAIPTPADADQWLHGW
jgi:flavin reductase (DIM6/NTAB) family NADH-FMN oxidoreductase RutF